MVVEIGVYTFAELRDGALAQISVGDLAHENVLRAIELLGTEVAPAAREAITRRTGASAPLA